MNGYTRKKLKIQHNSYPILGQSFLCFWEDCMKRDRFDPI